MNDRAKTAGINLNPLDQPLVDGVRAGRTRALARAITLVESTRADHQRRAAGLLDALAPWAGGAIRLGIGGAPGAGKSTLIEALGLELVGRGRRVAVLAVDPSSTVSGGSILGDKTRMERLSHHPHAYVRPSPSRGAVGGVGGRTREAVMICEAAGFEVVIVETVGVGQSETAVAGMVDVLALIELPNAGDDLQAMKKGLGELADVIVVNKADLDPEAAEAARRRIAAARPSVVALTAAAARGEGIAPFWAEVERLHAERTFTGALAARRARQQVDWMWELINDGLRSRFRTDPRVQYELAPTARSVARGETAPSAAALRLLDLACPTQHGEPTK